MHAHGAITTVGQTVVVLLVLSAGAFGQEPPARDRDVTITITAPNGGEVWTAGTYQTITWVPTGGWPYSAEISLWKSGAFYTYIGTTSSSYGSYDWLVCPLVGDGADYTVHIAITDSPTPAEDDSDAPFEITGSAPVPTLAVTSPNGGESWVAGKTQTITWSSTDPSGYVAAWLYQGGERDLFVGHVPMSAGELTWDVPPYLGDASDYTIRLTWVDECGPAREDFSDGPFAVTDSRPLPTITVTAPNGGEVWTADTVQTITWDSTSPAGDIEIWLNHDESGYEYIGSAPMADGQFVWSLLPCVPVTTDCRIEVRWSDGGRSVADASDAAFELTGATEPVLVVTNPSAGTEWTAGTTQTVTWTSSVAHGDVVVELYKGSAFYAVLGRAPAAAGSLTWDICPGIGDGSYTIQLALESCGTYVTGGTFDIAGSVTPTLTLISPRWRRDVDRRAAVHDPVDELEPGGLSRYLPAGQHAGAVRTRGGADFGRELHVGDSAEPDLAAAGAGDAGGRCEDPVVRVRAGGERGGRRVHDRAGDSAAGRPRRRQRHRSTRSGRVPGVFHGAWANVPRPGV
jgi:hypothetical protein